MENNMESTRTAQLEELLRRMHESQDHFVAWLKELPADEILDLAFEYSLRENIIYLIEETEEQTEAVAELLLQLNDPLTSIATTIFERGFETWNDTIAASIDATAEKVLLQCRYQELMEEIVANNGAPSRTQEMGVLNDGKK